MIAEVLYDRMGLITLSNHVYLPDWHGLTLSAFHLTYLTVTPRMWPQSKVNQQVDGECKVIHGFSKFRCEGVIVFCGMLPDASSSIAIESRQRRQGGMAAVVH